MKNLSKIDKISLEYISNSIYNTLSSIQDDVLYTYLSDINKVLNDIIKGKRK